MIRHKLNERESETRDRLISAALFEFANRGIFGTTLREITERAKANIAAVNYHFGSKEGLIRSVLDYCLRPLNDARLRALDQCDQTASGAPTLRLLVDAFVRPVVVHSVDSKGGRAPIRLLLQVRAIPHPLTTAILADHLDQTHQRFLAAFHGVLPHLSRRDVAMRYDFARGAVLQIIGDLDPTARDLPGLGVRHSPAENERVIRQLTQFIVAGFLAPPALATGVKSNSEGPSRFRRNGAAAGRV